MREASHFVPGGAFGLRGGGGLRAGEGCGLRTGSRTGSNVRFGGSRRGGAGIAKMVAVAAALAERSAETVRRNV
jgi:hypothetical protein